MDETTGHTREQLLEAKLELIRQQMGAGFARIEDALKAHEQKASAASAAVAEVEDRLRQLEIDHAKESTKLKILMAAMSLGSSGIGAAVAKFVL